MSNLKELFEYKNLPKDNNIINDYEIFKDKDLLDKCCKLLNKTQYDVVMNGIKKVIELI